ncbi:TolC family protein [Zhongshania arctica]|uniref:TolC family protein n=1 Tax=Zhongshania arctica TaxID=3238302 RepID=A0ABV3TX68_9GAMM
MKFLVALGLIASAPLIFAQEPAPELSLNAAIAAAITSDPWLNGSRHREDALSSESVSAASLPDPKISLMAGNFPVDTLDFNQEAMTQLALGVSQMFPRGDSLTLSSRQKRELAAQEPMLRLDREAKVTATVAQLWLEEYKAQESIRLIERDRSLFEQLVDAARASYSSALGRARQQDIIRAQLELTRIDDRLTVLLQQQESAQRRLSEWIGVRAQLPLAPLLPNDEPSLPESALLVPVHNDRSRYERISLHPLLQAFDQRINAMQTGVELARQKYKPEWGLTAQYGYRDDDPLGRDRADLFSIGVSFDMPLFTANRQDKDVSAAVSRAEAIKTDKQLLSRQLMASLDMAIVQLQRLNQRLTLYKDQLLPQMASQAEAALTAYDSDDGDFAEAVRARIAELNTKIEALVIAVERQQTIVKINYLLSGSSVAIHTPATQLGDEYETNF